ncbi:MAG: sulfonate ABC transporter ATP-binding protein [Chloroflexi bacterium HGW-Chloroflexi-3]|nr:MAG: sulfonate ABC transporter ATP-binding protein [Chloroflexi bacterium HGW-Chloroflexi-3]
MQISIQSLSHQYFNGKTTHALEDIHLDISQKQFVALIGPSGCGKSTLIRLIANLIAPSQGEIRIGEFHPKQAIENGQVAWMAQSPALLPWLTVEGNLRLAERFQKVKNQQPLSVEQVLKRVGLEGAADQHPYTLSGGMQQRLALARLLLQDAPIWLMDEPFAALDELTRERLTEELFSLWKDFSPTVLWITHNIHEAIKLSDRILVFSEQPGRIVADIPTAIPHPRLENNPDFQELLFRLRSILHHDPNGNFNHAA